MKMNSTESLFSPLPEFNCLKLEINDREKYRKCMKIMGPFFISKSQVFGIQKAFADEINFGLSLDSPIASSLQMENTLVPPKWHNVKDGNYLALDFGGSQTIRLLSAKFSGDKDKDEFVIKNYKITETIPSSHLFFDFLAKCVKNFVQEFEIKENPIPLGFTFSFPMDMKAINCGLIKTWTKDFNYSDVIGKDAASLLQQAINEQNNLNVEVKAIINDTTGILVRGAYLYPDCYIGLGLGSGLNACYLESIHNIKKHCDRSFDSYPIDTEFGAFGDNGVINFVRTKFDTEVDRETTNSTEFTFDKYIGGKYIGELIRKVLIKFIDEKILFNGFLTNKLNTFGSISAIDLSVIQENEQENEKICEIFKSLDYKEEQISSDEIEIIKYICNVITLRGAVLIASCLSVLVQRIESNDITICGSGSLIESHPKLRHLILSLVRNLNANKSQIKLELVKDGPLIGAAIIAATL